MAIDNNKCDNLIIPKRFFKIQDGKTFLFFYFLIKQTKLQQNVLVQQLTF